MNQNQPDNQAYEELRHQHYENTGFQPYDSLNKYSTDNV